MRAIYSLFVWCVWGLHLLVLGPLVLVTLLLSRPAGFIAARAMVGSALGLVGVQVRVTGLEQVDWDQAHVFMGNHLSLLDHLALLLVIPRPLVGIEKQENHRIPIYGSISAAWGNLPIDRRNPEASHRTLALAAERLRQGTSIAILPEGTRSKDGQLGPFKKGGFHLALETQADIVPFAFRGVHAMMPPGDWRLRPGTIEVEFGPAIPTQGLGRADLDGLLQRVRGAIMTLAAS